MSDLPKPSDMCTCGLVRSVHESYDAEGARIFPLRNAVGDYVSSDEAEDSQHVASNVARWGGHARFDKVRRRGHTTCAAFELYVPPPPEPEPEPVPDPLPYAPSSEPGNPVPEPVPTGEDESVSPTQPPTRREEEEG